MEKLFTSLAYKYVALALMMAEANHAVRQLEVTGWKPVEPSGVVSYYVAPPRLRPGGSLDTQTHVFGFGSQGNLQFIHRREPKPDISLEERHQQWANMKSLVGTNEAYALASNWLVRLEVDVPTLEKSHPWSVTQEYYHPGGQTSLRVMLPRYEVRWGTNQSRPAVWVSIFGPTKEAIHIRQEDISFSKRPRGLVKDAERLLAIPNGEFATWSVLEKSNLVVESSIATYAEFPLPIVVPRDRVTNSTARQAVESSNSLKPPHSLKPNQERIHNVPSKNAKPGP